MVRMHFPVKRLQIGRCENEHDENNAQDEKRDHSESREPFCSGTCYLKQQDTHQAMTGTTLIFIAIYTHWHTTDAICWFPAEKPVTLTHLFIK